MYIEVVPNRDSKPCILLRESYRQDGKVRKRTLANLSKLPPQAVEGLRALFRGGTVIEDFSQSFEVVRSQPFGHIAAVLGTLRQIGLDRDLDPQGCAERDLVMAMIVARLLEPASKLATARGLGEEAPLSALVEDLDLSKVNRASCTPPWIGCTCTKEPLRSAWPAAISKMGVSCCTTCLLRTLKGTVVPWPNSATPGMARRGPCRLCSVFCATPQDVRSRSKSSRATRPIRRP